MLCGSAERRLISEVFARMPLVGRDSSEPSQWRRASPVAVGGRMLRINRKLRACAISRAIYRLADAGRPETS
jgi:hypothetical protein